MYNFYYYLIHINLHSTIIINKKNLKNVHLYKLSFDYKKEHNKLNILLILIYLFYMNKLIINGF